MTINAWKDVNTWDAFDPLAVDSVPSVIRATVEATSTVSDGATAPTTGNTEIRFDDGSGHQATVNSVTGSNPYDVDYTFPRTTAKLFSVTGYPVFHKVGSEEATSANVPYLPPTTQDYQDLVSPSNGAGTLGETYAGSPAADGDQWVFDTTLTGDNTITVTVDEKGYWILSGTPNVDSSISFYRIDSDGTVDVVDTITFESVSNTLVAAEGVGTSTGSSVDFSISMPVSAGVGTSTGSSVGLDVTAILVAGAGTGVSSGASVNFLPREGESLEITAGVATSTGSAVGFAGGQIMPPSLTDEDLAKIVNAVLDALGEYGVDTLTNVKPSIGV